MALKSNAHVTLNNTPCNVKAVVINKRLLFQSPKLLHRKHHNFYIFLISKK